MATQTFLPDDSEATARVARNSAYFSALGRRGGNAVKAKHGPDFYATIGRKGGLAARRLRQRPPDNRWVLGLLGLGESVEPTDIARFKDEYLAQATLGAGPVTGQ